MELFKNYIYVKRFAINPDAIRYIAFDDDVKAVTFYFDEDHRLTITDDKEFYRNMKHLAGSNKLGSD